MKTYKMFAVLIFSAVILSGCGEKTANNKEQAPPQTTTNMDVTRDPGSEKDFTGNVKMTSNTQADDKQIPVQNRLIVRNGSMSVEIDSYDESQKKVTGIVNEINGFIISENSNANASGKKQGTISMKVPAEKYDELLNRMSEVGKVMSQNISATDVTEEYIDLEARMKTQKELEQRLLELLNNKTGGLTDVLEVEQKLADIRQKIESTEGRMKFLEKQAAYSTLTLSLFEPSLLQTSSGGGFFYEIGQGFKNGLEGFTGVLKTLITILIALIPLWILIIIALFVLRAFLKRRKLKLNQKVVQS